MTYTDATPDVQEGDGPPLTREEFARQMVYAEFGYRHARHLHQSNHIPPRVSRKQDPEPNPAASPG